MAAAARSRRELRPPDFDAVAAALAAVLRSALASQAPLATGRIMSISPLLSMPVPAMQGSSIPVSGMPVSNMPLAVMSIFQGGPPRPLGHRPSPAGREFAVP